MPDTVHDALLHFAQNSKLLSLLDRPGLLRLARIGALQAYATDAVIVHQGALGDTFYLIVRGQVRVLVEEAGGEVARLGPGMFFGEIGVMTRQPRSATVQTCEASELISFPRDPVMTVLQNYPLVREVIGSVGLQRSEANLQRALDDDDDDSFGLSELLEGDESS